MSGTKAVGSAPYYSCPVVWPAWWKISMRRNGETCAELICFVTCITKVHWQENCLLPLSTWECIGIPIKELGELSPSVVLGCDFDLFFLVCLGEYLSSVLLSFLTPINICEAQMCGEVQNPFNFLRFVFKPDWEWHTYAVHLQTPIRGADVWGVNCLDLKIYMCV